MSAQADGPQWCWLRLSGGLTVALCLLLAGNYWYFSNRGMIIQGNAQADALMVTVDHLETELRNEKTKSARLQRQLSESAARPTVDAGTMIGNLNWNTVTLSQLLQPQRPQVRRVWSETTTARQREIDKLDEAKRCERYGWRLDPRRSRETRRKIFFGSSIAAESLTTFKIHAAESYNIYDTVALVESSITQSGAHRSPYHSPWFLESGIFGENTTIAYKFHSGPEYLLDAETPLVRENFQRQQVFELWLANGMGADDIGFLGDIDEVWTRDAFRAMQGSPQCYRSTYGFHPGVIIGRCISRIGDGTNRPDPRPRYNGSRSSLSLNHLKEQMIQKRTKASKWPLWNAWDYRMRSNVQNGPGNEKWSTWNVQLREHETQITAFHVHNFYDDVDTIRQKYATYGHASRSFENLVRSGTLSGISKDLDTALKCAVNAPDGGRLQFVNGSFPQLSHRIPIYFDDDFLQTGHAAMQKLANIGNVTTNSFSKHQSNSQPPPPPRQKGIGCKKSKLVQPNSAGVAAFASDKGLSKAQHGMLDGQRIRQVRTCICSEFVLCTSDPAVAQICQPGWSDMVETCNTWSIFDQDEQLHGIIRDASIQSSDCRWIGTCEPERGGKAITL